MKLKKWFGITVLAAAAVIGLAACCSGNKTDNAKTVKIGVMTKSDSEEKRLDKIQELLKKDNIKLEFTEFTDYSQPNKAVADCAVDINGFKHYYFLNNWNK
ncbi:MetQ/NlpA family ABC transporter substrate-binding protein, partial [Proteus mirabilis]